MKLFAFILCAVSLAGCGDRQQIKDEPALPSLERTHTALWRTQTPDKFGVVCYEAMGVHSLSCVKVE